MFIWQASDWPQLLYRSDDLLALLGETRLRQGLHLGRMRSLEFELQLGAGLESLTDEVLETSRIEGEVLDRGSVRSSLVRRLGIPEEATALPDARTEGIVEVMIDATSFLERPLTEDQLKGWQAALFPTGYSGLHRIRVGDWRDDAHGPMQVASGRPGRHRIHYEAPPADRVPEEMEAFLHWFNNTPFEDGLLRAGLAHFWFVTIHPFDDGNGRIARAIADRALVQAEESGQRFYSMSAQIRKERKEYYRILEQTQRGPMDVTPWLKWFLECLGRAIDGAAGTCRQVLQKADFWQRHSQTPLTERQRKLLNRVFDGFDGKLTTKKWGAIAKCSIATAQRDINDLILKGILAPREGSKNTSYVFQEWD